MHDTSPKSGLTLSRHSGRALLTSGEALLKGIFESDVGVDAVYSPESSQVFGLASLRKSESVREVAALHRTRIVNTPDAGRALQLALRSAKHGGRTVVTLPASELGASLDDLIGAVNSPLGESGSLLILLEIDADEPISRSIRVTLLDAGAAMLEAVDLDWMRSSIDMALRLSRTGGRAVVTLVHRNILRSADTLECRPNRVSDPHDVEAFIRRRRRRVRMVETDSLLRLSRRMELNHLNNLPSPGERVVTGFVAVGPAATTLRHVLYELQLVGRVPVLELGLLNPFDEAMIERFLVRAEQIVVLESSPGQIESHVLRVAESLRVRGQRPATVWGSVIPSDGKDEPIRLHRDDALHPSLLARRILHLLHQLRPTRMVASRLVADLPPGTVSPDALPARPLVRMRDRVVELIEWTNQRLHERATQDDQPIDPTLLELDVGEQARDGVRVVPAELWAASKFRREAWSAIGQGGRSTPRIVFFVIDDGIGESGELERIARSALPASAARDAQVTVTDLSDRERAIEVLEHGCLSASVTVIIISRIETESEGDQERWRIIDRLGFQPTEQLVRSADEVCQIRRPAGGTDGPERSQVGRTGQPESKLDMLPRRFRRQFLLRLQPLTEHIEVVRTRPPLLRRRSSTASRLPPPTILHGHQPAWRAHVAGCRGETPGVVALVLIEAGRSMGYHIRTLVDPLALGDGITAWCQLLFTRPRPDEPALSITTEIPQGEADLILGVDPWGAVDVINGRSERCIAHPDRTHLFLDLSPLESAGLTPGTRQALLLELEARTVDPTRFIASLGPVVQNTLGTERLTDLVLLGAAYQQGTVPLSIVSLEGALERMAERGFGRATEAFNFGRSLMVDPTPLTRTREERRDSVEHLLRRVELSVTFSPRRIRRRRSSFVRLLREGMKSMPGLSETDRGREALRDYILAMDRCLRWGGVAHAQRYRDLLVNLYRADRGDRGRSLTRDAVLPLAEAMLPRDNLFVAAMAVSLDAKFQTRRVLRARASRGDEITRRYVNLLEIVAFRRRWRFEFRSSDWPAALSFMAAPLIPQRWRGTPADRRLRGYVSQICQQAMTEAGDRYDAWAAALHRLHELASQGRLRALPLAHVRRIVAAPTRSRRANDIDISGRSDDEEAVASLSPSPESAQADRARRS